jgi:hypothetical protein
VKRDVDQRLQIGEVGNAWPGPDKARLSGGVATAPSWVGQLRRAEANDGAVWVGNVEGCALAMRMTGALGRASAGVRCWVRSGLHRCAVPRPP